MYEAYEGKCNVAHATKMTNLLYMARLCPHNTELFTITVSSLRLKHPFVNK